MIYLVKKLELIYLTQKGIASHTKVNKRGSYGTLSIRQQTLVTLG